MFAKSLAALTIVSVSILATGATPAKRDDEGFSIPGLPEITVSSFDDVAPVLSSIEANSGRVAAAAGTSSMLDVEADFIFIEATSAIGTTQTAISAFVTTVSGTPVVQVSSVGGTDVVTLATGSGSLTTFAGHTFTAAVLGAQKQSYAVQDVVVPKALVAGAVTVVGAMVFGATAVL